MSTLPPGVIEQKGRLVRIKIVPVADGTTREQIRPVTLDFEEAKLRRMDWYHHELGWILEGYKLEQDRPEQSIMDDESQAVAAHEEDRKSVKEEVSG